MAFDAKAATVYCDATIAFPMIVAAIKQEGEDFAERKAMPKFSMGREPGQ